MDEITISLSGFLFEDRYLSQSVGFEHFCAIARSAGYNGVELRRTQVSVDTSKWERRRLLGIVRDHGLYVTCLTAREMPGSGAARAEAFSRYLELCSDLACGLLKITGEPTEDQDWMARVVQQAGKQGVVLAVNNHMGTPIETIDGLRGYFQAFPDVGLLYDPFHLRAVCEDYIGCIPEFAGITRNILMQSRRMTAGKNGSMQGRCWENTLPDEEGAQDWKGVFAAFKHRKYNQMITVIENGWPINQREYVAEYYGRFIRQAWQEDGSGYTD